MNIFFELKNNLIEIISKLADQSQSSISEKQFNSFTVEPTRDKKHGDLATNAAMVFCKNFGLKPRDLAEKIIADLEKNPQIIKTEIAGAGFINITLKNQVWQSFVADILQKPEFELPKLSDGKELINIEYASPNPTGPMHIGHSRGAIYGDVLASLLEKTGHNITREYYINDAGSQIITLAKSAYLRYLEALGEEITIPEGLYPGEYLKPAGEKIKEQFGDSLKGKDEAEYLPLIRDLVVDEMLKMIVSDLAELGIKHDTLFSEKKNLHQTGKIDAAIEALRAKGLVYEGKIEAPKDANLVAKDFEEDISKRDNQTLFRTTDFGDDSDRVIKKSDGTPTYLAGDIAYLQNKFERGATKMILPLGYDHAGYVKRLTAACTAITNGKASVKVILCQMVKFVKNGEQLKMSKRSGNFVSLKDVLDEVGADALRFTMLTRKNDAPFDFDLSKVIDQSKDNPIFYVEYAYARCSSVLRNLKEQMPEINLQEIDDSLLNKLKDESEIELIKKLANYPRIVEMAVANYEPHRIAFYLQELAGMFHSLWNKGSDNPELKFIILDNKNLTIARAYLLIAIQKIIFSALGIFNIKPPEEMR
ncbi:MAG: arginyl-tRNA synthetase [Rickettsiales bacterium]|jgi:arginyl-tRNA synthetase